MSSLSSTSPRTFNLWHSQPWELLLRRMLVLVHGSRLRTQLRALAGLVAMFTVASSSNLAWQLQCLPGQASTVLCWQTVHLLFTFMRHRRTSSITLPTLHSPHLLFKYDFLLPRFLFLYTSASSLFCFTFQICFLLHILLATLTMNYRNCAPPPSGVNFQPPVPDTTFGTIPHVHVPRFDAGATQVGLPIPPMMFQAQQPQMMQMQMTPALPVQAQPLQVPYMSNPTCTTVLVPSTFYVNEYPYYAS